MDDPLTRFNLSLEFGHLDEALSCAKKIDQKVFFSNFQGRISCGIFRACGIVWGRKHYDKEMCRYDRDGDEAVDGGVDQMVEMVYQKTRNLSGLSFLYLSTGNRDKLKKMLAIAKKRNDPMER